MYARKTKHIIIALLWALCLIGTCSIASAQKNKVAQEKADVMTLDFEDNLATPQVKNKLHADIVAYQRKVGDNLIKQGYKVQSIRKGEVLIIVIPAHELFAQNDVELMESAGKELQPIAKLLATARMYKYLLAMHSDNTGNDLYCENLTNDRVISVYNWFRDNCNLTSALVPYAMGNSEPLLENNSRANRQINRRLEIYLVPDEQMIERAKAKTLR
ncbi:MAG: OmpA family protein [Muribaculaceae bacterium]|nr:OmpA family protein [Muribaculaceae bacterium]